MDDRKGRLVLVVNDGEAARALERRQRVHDELHALKEQIKEVREDKFDELVRLKELLDFIDQILNTHLEDSKFSETVKKLQEVMRDWQEFKQESSSEEFHQIFHACLESQQDGSKKNKQQTEDT